jgi:hypothetical protein
METSIRLSGVAAYAPSDPSFGRRLIGNSASARTPFAGTMSQVLALFALAAPLYPQEATTPPAALTLEQKEEFLKTAKVIRTRGANKGITRTVRVTLSDGVTTHDASVQRIDEEKAKFEGTNGTEINFRDTYKFNIAAYRLGRLVGLGEMIPPSIERKYEGTAAAWTWWVEDVQLDEGERLKKKISAPDKDTWARQFHIMRIFDQLISNTDRNVQNILYDKTWHLWMIDHSRAFRTRTDVLDKKALDRCDAGLLAHFKLLQEDKLRSEVGSWLRDPEIKGLLARRNRIVAYFEKSPDKLYDYLSGR